jgi:hypothetical protein
MAIVNQPQQHNVIQLSWQEYIRNALQRIQRKLSFEDWKDYSQFATNNVSHLRSSIVGSVILSFFLLI